MLCYIFLLHQTTTSLRYSNSQRRLCYIFLLHQTTTVAVSRRAFLCCVISFFYIKPQLHHGVLSWVECCVISFFYIKPQQVAPTSAGQVGCVISFFYIKPQHWNNLRNTEVVVLYLSSTSNHNIGRSCICAHPVVLYLSSTSNHNCRFISVRKE